MDNTKPVVNKQLYINNKFKAVINNDISLKTMTALEGIMYEMKNVF